jgi:cellulose biosynthesis protein BcsQ
MKSVFWGNYKGGVGKTTSTFQIAAHFAINGKKVLLVDLDPQCSLSNICCRDIGKDLDEPDDIKVAQTFNYILELYMREIYGNDRFAFQLLAGTLHSEARKYLEAAIFSFTGKWAQNNLYFIPSKLNLKNARMNELAQFMNGNVYNVFLIRQFLEDIWAIGADKNEFLFDYVFFDCPPTTNMLTQSVFLASDYYIIPTICDEVSTKGVPDYIAEIEKTRDKYSLNDTLRGVLVEKAFPNKPLFVGAFETLYKGRAGSLLNYAIMESLDRNINTTIEKTGIESILSRPGFAKHRYDSSNGDDPATGKPINPESITTRHVFHSVNSIDHRDARASGESIPKNTANAQPSAEYRDLALALMDMI